MAEEKVKLYGHWASPFSKRVEIALKMKGVEYEYFGEDLENSNKSPDLLRYNPVHKKVPVLVHGDKAIAESQVILEYIDETWDSGICLLPRDPYERALARFWARFVDDKLLPSTTKIVWLGENKAMEEAEENLKILDQQLAGKRFFGGESVGFVDIVAGLIGYWLGVVEEATGVVLVTNQAFPSVYKWRHEFVAIEAICNILPPKGKLVEFLSARIEATRAAPAIN